MRSTSRRCSAPAPATRRSGVRNTAGVNDLTLAGPTWVQILDFPAQIQADDADVGSMGWVMHPLAQKKLRSTLKTTADTSSNFQMAEPGSLAGYPVATTTAITTTTTSTVIFGAWSQLLVGYWTGTICWSTRTTVLRIWPAVSWSGRCATTTLLCGTPRASPSARTSRSTHGAGIERRAAAEVRSGNGRSLSGLCGGVRRRDQDRRLRRDGAPWRLPALASRAAPTSCCWSTTTWAGCWPGPKPAR